MIEEATLGRAPGSRSLPPVRAVRGVSRSWYYEKPRAAERRAREDVALRDATSSGSSRSSPATASAR